ncbi:hypothetical protein KCU85_g9779, partial [Aureobasidium melanogenum]
MTIEVHELSKEGFDFSVLVQIAAMLYQENRAKIGELKFKDFDWWLECTDPLLKCSCVRNVVDNLLTWLLDDIYKKTTTAAADTSKAFQEFSSQLKRWLLQEFDMKDRTCWIRETLRRCMKVTDMYDRAGVLDDYYEICECPMDSELDSDLDLVPDSDSDLDSD